MNAPAAAPARPWVGSSSIAGILGLSPFSTPLQEYQKMVGEAPELCAADEAFFRRRKALEPYVAAVAQDRYGLQVVAQNVRYVDSACDYLRAEIDAEAIDLEDGEAVNLEFKTCHPYAAKEWGESGSDVYPIYVAAQVQQGLAIRPKKRSVLIACIGFDDFRRYDVLPDPEIAKRLRTDAVAFWEGHVLPRLPPAPVSVEDVKRRYVTSFAKPIEATAEILSQVEQHALLGAQAKASKEASDDVALELKKYLGDHDTLTWQGRVLATWKSNKASTVTDYQQLALQLLDALPAERRLELIQRFTKSQPGNRPLLNKLK